MENFRIVKYIFFLTLGGAVLWTPLFVIGYEPQTTHRALTQEVVKFFNNKYPDKALSDSEKALVEQGSVGEDEGTRPLRHFYDPVYSRGLTITGKKFLSAKQWSEDTLSQAGYFDSAFAGTITSYFSGDSDYSWERAIYEYSWGDKNRGLESLGHILHLLEDMAVPDHTRNDPHPPYADFLFGQASPYEHWANKFTTDSIDTGKILKVSDSPFIASLLGSYFDSVATYSNNNFFSKDTITNDVYSLPKLDSVVTRVKLSDGKFYSFIIALNIYLARYDETLNLQTGELERDYGLNDKDDLILSDYWTHLSRQAIINGAGVVKLFFDEVAKEKQTKMLYNKNRSWWGKQMDAFKKTVFGVAGILYGSSVTINDLSDDVLENTNNISFPPENQQVAVSPQDTPLLPPENGFQTASALSPGAEEALALPVVVTKPASSQSSFLAPPSQFFAPQDQAGPTISVVSSENALASAGDSASTTSLETSATTTPEIVPLVDSTPPDIQFSVSECEHRVSSSGCVLATTTLHIVWSSSASDLDEYLLTCAIENTPCPGFLYDPHATSTVFFGQDNVIYVFSAKAKDVAGNISEPIIKNIEIRKMPLVINEIAWMGTGGNATTSKDEWLELRSNSSQPIDLSGWSLVFLKPATTTPFAVIPLSGTIAPRAYYLIERTNDAVISNISADLATPFGTGLVDSGMTVKLLYRETVFDQTPDAALGWSAGSLSERRTMERIDPLADGVNRDNWGTYQQNEIAEKAKNVEGVAIHGTPVSRNSLNFLISQNGIVSRDTTLYKDNSPYLISSGGLTVNEGVTFTIEHGTVIKIVSSSLTFFKINGALKVLGTVDDPVVITSVNDDTYGGDTNQDGTCDTANASSTSRCPKAGDWGSLLFNSTSHDSEVSHAIIRYGGRWFNSIPFGNIIGMVIADHASPVFDSVRVEYSQTSGVALFGSSAHISASEFLHNKKTEFNNVAGIFVNGGSPTIIQSLFDDNVVGIQTQGQDGGEITGNTFINQIGPAIVMVGGMPLFSGNQAHDNGLDAIDVMLVSAFHDYTLSQDLPYVVGRDAAFQVRPATRLTIQAGVIMKFKSNSSGIAVNGTLDVQGTEASPVVFTHFADDSYGGDTNKDATTTIAIPGSWGNIVFNNHATSTIDHAIIRYGGADSAGVKANNSVLEIKNSIVENNKFKGIMFSHALGSVNDTVIRNHREPVGSGTIGLYLLQGSVVAVGNAVFRNNERGIVVDGTSSLINNGGIDIDSSNDTKTFPANLLP